MYKVFLKGVLGEKHAIVYPIPVPYKCDNYREIYNTAVDQKAIIAELHSNNIEVIYVKLNGSIYCLKAINIRLIQNYKLLIEPTIPKLLGDCAEKITLYGTTRYTKRRSMSIAPVFAAFSSVKITDDG